LKVETTEIHFIAALLGDYSTICPVTENEDSVQILYFRGYFRRRSATTVWSSATGACYVQAISAKSDVDADRPTDRRSRASV